MMNGKEILKAYENTSDKVVSYLMMGSGTFTGVGSIVNENIYFTVLGMGIFLGGIIIHGQLESHAYNIARLDHLENGRFTRLEEITKEKEIDIEGLPDVEDHRV